MGGFLSLFAGLSALGGVCLATGFRIWFVMLLLVVRVLIVTTIAQSLATTAGCPGPFS